jgi:transcriptional regulator with XRE-family HTH domain
VVRELRKYLGFKQLALADAAGVTERTIQRVERGGTVEDETLRKVARALGLGENAFLRPDYHPSTEELKAFAKSVRDDYTVTDLLNLSSQNDLDGILTADACQIDGSAVKENLAAEVASLQDEIEELGSVYEELSNVERLEARQGLFKHIQNVACTGYRARWAVFETDDKWNVGVLVFQDGQTKDNEFSKLIIPRRFPMLMPG